MIERKQSCKCGSTREKVYRAYDYDRPVPSGKGVWDEQAKRWKVKPKQYERVAQTKRVCCGCREVSWDKGDHYRRVR